jgi:hypothetical protein
VRHATWEVEGKVLTARDRVLGLEIWRHESSGLIKDAVEAPWSSGEILVGHGSQSRDGSRVLCLDRSSGDVRWEFALDTALLEAAFGKEILRPANMGLNRFIAADLDGDGEREVILNFVHGHNYPTSLCWVDRDGRLRGQYVHKGHLMRETVTDLDRDGFDDLVVAGTNNSTAYQGATVVVLDHAHFRGASVDSLTDAWSALPDSARVRIVFPAFPEPYQTMMVQQRLCAVLVKTIEDGGRARLLVEVGNMLKNDHRLSILLDAELHPLSVGIKDAFREHIARTWPDSLKNGTGPLDPAWRNEWLARSVRFEAGHWPPGSR